MATFSRSVFLPSSRKSLYARLTIPEPLRPLFQGRAEVWRSLKTLDKETARVRLTFPRLLHHS
jgi:hypothetical protein